MITIVVALAAVVAFVVVVVVVVRVAVEAVMKWKISILQQLLLYCSKPFPRHFASLPGATATLVQY